MHIYLAIESEMKTDVGDRNLLIYGDLTMIAVPYTKFIKNDHYCEICPKQTESFVLGKLNNGNLFSFLNSNHRYTTIH